MNRPARGLLLVLFVLQSGRAAAQSGSTLQLVHADSARGYLENGRLVRELEGRVEFVQDTSRMYCDRAIQYPEEKLVIFGGRVRIVTPPRELQADKIYHYEVRREQMASGSARLITPRQILTADALHYFEKEDRAVAEGHAVIADTVERAALSGHRIEYLRLQGYARVDGAPLFVRHDSTGSDSLAVRARMMEMFEDGERVVARDEVTVSQGEVSADCGEMHFIRKTDKITLKLQPRAKRSFDFLRGTEIDLLLRERLLTGIGIRGNAIVVTRVDTLTSPEAQYDYLSGEEIYIRVREKQIDSVFVHERATSYYHLYDEKKYQGINKILGDELTMCFGEGKVRKVGVRSNPAASNGIFYPEGKEGPLLKELDPLLQPFQLKTDKGPIDDR
jgi:lipopolysaccharide export system protein LptA